MGTVVLGLPFHYRYKRYPISLVWIDDWRKLHVIVEGAMQLTNTNLNTLRPRQNGHHFPDDIFQWIFLNESVWISINISLKFVPRDPINNIPTLVKVMAWRRPGASHYLNQWLLDLPTYICVTRPEWVNWLHYLSSRHQGYQFQRK